MPEVPEATAPLLVPAAAAITTPAPVASVPAAAAPTAEEPTPPTQVAHSAEVLVVAEAATAAATTETTRGCYDEAKDGSKEC